MTTLGDLPFLGKKLAANTEEILSLKIREKARTEKVLTEVIRG